MKNDARELALAHAVDVVRITGNGDIMKTAETFLKFLEPEDGIVKTYITCPDCGHEFLYQVRTK